MKLQKKKIMDNYYARVGDLSELLKEYIIKRIPKNKVKITVTVHRNKDMVEFIKKQVMEHFE